MDNLKHFKTKYVDYYKDDKGMKQGKYFTYDNKDHILMIENYVDDVREGECKTYYSNEVVRSICNYVDGRLQGEFVVYRVTGEKWEKRYYVSGKLHGFQVRYCPTKTITKFYIMDKRVDLSIHGMDINNLTEDDMNLLRVIYAYTC